MSAKNDAKTYGIIVKMPENDPMSAPHLLGESWAGERWFETEAERDNAYEGHCTNYSYISHCRGPHFLL